MLRDNKYVIPSDRLRHDIAGGLSHWVQHLSEIVRVSLRNFVFLIVHLTQYSSTKVFSHCFGIMLFALAATQAQAVTNVSGTIAADTTWDVAGSPYVLTGSLTVDTGVTLTLAPGTVVKSQIGGIYSGGGYITVNGTLRAIGTPSAPIVFTSVKDDSYGGDSNGDGAATTPQPGDWEGLHFLSTSVNNVLQNVVVRYGGGSYSTYPFGRNYPFYMANIYTESSSLTIADSVLTDAGDRNGDYGHPAPSTGISISGASPTITGSVIERNSGAGISLSTSNAQITGNTIRNNKTGISGSSSSTPTITGNTITANTGKALDFDVTSISATVSPNTINGNGANGFSIGGGTISTNTVLNATIPYVLTGSLTVDTGVTLTLEPGTVVKNQIGGIYSGGGYITVNGTLRAIGTPSAPIIFTSLKDDSYGGDSNGDGAATTPQAGDWEGLHFLSTSVNNVLQNVVIRCGGGSYSTYPFGRNYPFYMANIYTESSSLTITDSVIAEAGDQNQDYGHPAKSTGISISGSSPTITGSVIERTSGAGISLSTSNAQITGNTIRNNANGIYANGITAAQITGNTISGSTSDGIYAVGSGALTVTGNTLTGNTGRAVNLSGTVSRSAFSGNAFSGNGTNGIQVNGSLDQNTTWGTDAPYVINGTVTIPAGVTLTLLPGTVVKGLNVAGRLAVDGTLIANGTAALPIVFTSYKDDTYGGDTNGDGSATTPAAGDWVGIGFSNTSTNDQLSNVVVKYGGAKDVYYGSYHNFGTGANVYIGTSSLTLSASTVSDSLLSGAFGLFTPYGIIVLYASPTITGNVIERNNYGIYLDESNASIKGNTIRNNSRGIFAVRSTPTVTGNTITGNTQYGMSNGALPSVSAKSNYWGSSSGPYDPLDDRITGGWYNPNGTGDQVSNYVDYNPWLSYDPNAKTTISLSGYVNDTSTGLPLANAFVKLGMFGAYTNSSGHYIISNLASASYAIQATRSGYINYNSTGINPAVTPTYNITLTPDNTICVAGTLAGTVRSAMTGAVKGGVTVTLSSGASVQTDINTGQYSFANVTPGQVTLSLAVAGYAVYYQKLNACGNQTWDVALTANATTQGLNSQSGYSKDPVNTATGNYVYQHRDIQLPGKGMPFVFERNYNSQAGSASGAMSGPLGFGWTHNYNTALSLDAGGNVTVIWGDGKTESYAPNGTGGFTAQYGVFDTLTAKAGGTYTLRRKDLTAYNFDTTYRLTTIVDKNGNTIALTYTGGNLTQVTDTAGRNIDFTYDAGNRIITITDPIARTVQFTYDVAGDLATAQDANGNITHYTYDGSHQLTVLTDPRGNSVVTNIYDANNRVVTSQRDAKLGQTTYTYDAVNHKTTVTDALNNATVDYHDTLLRLIKQDDANGNHTLYHYDAAGNRDQTTDKKGNITAYTYDARGNVLTKTNALNGITTITYDALDNPLTRTDPLGAVTSFAYDANGNVTQNTDPLGKVTAFTYNAFGQPLTATDPLGHVTTNTYDGEGNLITVQDALNKETHYSYDAVGRRLTRTDTLNHATTYAYDANNNLLTVTAPGGGISTYTYDGNNNRLTAQDPMGNITRYAYDAKDLLTTTTDPLNRIVTVTYDALDRKIQERDRKDQQTTFTYDGAGRLLTASNPLGQITTYTYDADGNRLTEINPLGKTTTFVYDALNRLISTTDPLGNITTFAYDAAGRMTVKTNAKGQITRNDYDLIGRPLKVTDPAGGTAEYAYDAAGRRLSMKDTRGNVTTYAYDAAGRLTGKTEPLATVHQYDYDIAGRMIRYVSPKAEITTYSYDADDRLTGIAYPGGATVSYSYNANGLKTGMTDALGSTAFTYDTLNRLASSTDPFGHTVQYGYDENGNRTSITYPASKTVTYGYDAANRLATVQDWLNKTTTYAYDAAGRLTGAAITNGTAATYAYDDADRLTTLTHAKQETTLFQSAYTLDAIGNPLTETRTEPTSAAYENGNAAYLYDAENRLTSGGSHTYTYDAKGSLTADQRPDASVTAYTYDPEDRLTQSVIGGVTTQYGYDGTGARLTKSVSGTTTRYILDRGGSLSQVLAETDGNGVISAYYVYGHGLISRIASDETVRYYHHDSRGSTIALTDADGNITDAYSYDPFGTLRTAQGNTVQPFKYIGRHGVMDEGNSLSYIRARYYAPELGRFLTKDPLTGNDGDTQSLNRYVYALNNPIRLIDISGLSAKEGGVYQRSSSCTDELHAPLVDRVRRAKLNAISAQYAYIAALETEAAYWDALADVLEATGGALDAVGGLATGDWKDAIGGIGKMTSVLLRGLGYEKASQVTQEVSNVYDLGKGIVDLPGQIKSATTVFSSIKGVGRNGVNWMNLLLKTNISDPVGKLYKETITLPLSEKGIFDSVRDLW